MKTITKIVCLACMAVMVFALVACGNKSAEPTTNPPAEEKITEDIIVPESEEDAESNVEIIDTPVLGGWTAVRHLNVSDDMKVMFEKAVDGLVGAEYEPVWYVGSQIVNGTNHCFFAEITPVVPNPEPHFAFVYIHETLDGTVQLVNVHDLDITSVDEFDSVKDTFGDFFDYEVAADK